MTMMNNYGSSGVRRLVAAMARLQSYRCETEGREGTASAVPPRPHQKRALAPEGPHQLNLANASAAKAALLQLPSYGTTEVVPSRRKWPNLSAATCRRYGPTAKRKAAISDPTTAFEKTYRYCVDRRPEESL